MNPPSNYLLDEFIRYAEENNTTFSHAAGIIAEFAKQRAPEFAVETKTKDARQDIREKVEKSRKEEIVARFLVRTRVRYISWTYYPEFHLAAAPVDVWWCSIWYEKPDWQLGNQPGRFYLDDLFHDPDEGKFWMKEPYLSELPLSAALFDDLTKKEHETMQGTFFRKVDPRVIGAFKAARTGQQEFTIGYLDTKNVYRKPPYGAKGWQKRLKLVPPTLKRVRFKL